MSLSLLRSTGVRMLIIDELHNVLAGAGSSRREFLNLLRHMEVTEDGGRYKRCRRCGKDDDRGGGGTGASGAWAGLAGMG